jgi:NAD(P)-dependent dehydrogenase (short-subunit alcohol dehydrogenase family)
MSQKATSRIAQLVSHISTADTARQVVAQATSGDGARRSLSGKVTIITGAGSTMGMGRATAIAFAKAGAGVIYVTDLRTELLEPFAAELEKAHPGLTVIPRKVDAASENDVKEVCEDAVQRFGRLDVFFANAGIATGNRLGDISTEQFMHVMKTNALSVFIAIKYASEAMKVSGGKGGKKENGGGSIIATASVAGLRSGAGAADYSASKAAVINMVQSSCFQLARTNIRVNAICPGLIETGMTKTTFDHARSRGTTHKIGQLNPLARYGTSSEISEVVLFLASDDSSYVNGQSLAIDGGLSASLPFAPGKFF